MLAKEHIVASCKMGSCWIPSIPHKVLVVFKLSWVDRPKAMQNWEIRSYKTPSRLIGANNDNSVARLTEYTIIWQQWQKCRAPNCCSLVNYLVGRRKQLPLSWESKRPTPWMPPPQEIKASTRPLLRNHSGLHFLPYRWLFGGNVALGPLDFQYKDPKIHELADAWETVVFGWEFLSPFLWRCDAIYLYCYWYTYAYI